MNNREGASKSQRADLVVKNGKKKTPVQLLKIRRALVGRGAFVLKERNGITQISDTDKRRARKRGVACAR